MSTVQPISGRKAGELCRLLEERGIGDEEFQTRLIQGINDLVGWLRGDQQIYPVTVDYSKTIEEMVAAGGYSYVNAAITSAHFPPKGEGIVEVPIQLKHFNQVMSSDEVLKELGKMGLRPTVPMEHLALGAKCPDLQRQFPIPCLGQTWRDSDGDRQVLFLWSYARGRFLDLDDFEGDWSERYRFAAVPQVGNFVP